jgi:hypothetical protein
MKVNVYDPENIQKGRLMLLNIADDLKSVSKLKIAPGSATQLSTPTAPSDKP